MTQRWDLIDWAGAGALCLGFGFITVVAVKAFMVERERGNQIAIAAEKRAASIAAEASKAPGAVTALVGQLV
jgi:hypothetical protein